MGRHQTEAAYLKSVLLWLQGNWTEPDPPRFYSLKEVVPATSSPGGDAAVVGVAAAAGAAAAVAVAAGEAAAAVAAAVVAAAVVAAASPGDIAASAKEHTRSNPEHNKSPSQRCATGRGPTVLAVPTERSRSP
jgi:hypothetical protein